MVEKKQTLCEPLRLPLRPFALKKMTSTNPSKPNLKVVSDTPPTPKTPPQETTQTPYQRILIIGVILIGLGLASQIPVPTNIQAEGQLEPLPDSHQIIYAEINGVITEFSVKPNQQIEIGQSIAIISTEDLRGEIANTQAQFDKAISEFKAESFQLKTINAKVNEASQREAALRRQVAEDSQEIAQLAAGSPPPEIEKLKQDIAALQNNINGWKSEINGDRDHLNILQQQINRAKPLLKEGGIAMNQVDNMEIQAINIKSEIDTKQSKIKEIESQIAGKKQEIAAANKQKHDELKIHQDQLANLVAEGKTATEELEAARKGVESRIPLLNTLKTELSRQQDTQQSNQLLRAKKSGIIVTQDFQKFVGKKMQGGEPVLEIADLSKLRVILSVRQEDSDIINKGAKVTLHFKEPGLSNRSISIDQIYRVMQPDTSDPSQQKQVLNATAVIENTGNLLLPGGKVYAQIEGEKMPIYQKVRRELLKLFNVRKYGIDT